MRTRQRNPSPRSWTISTTRRNTPMSAHRCRRACCSLALREPARRCLQRLLQVRQTCRSSPCPARSLSRCSSAWAQARCATSSSRPRKRHPASSSSTRSTLSAKSVTISFPPTTNASRRSTSYSPKWMALRATTVSSSSPRRTGLNRLIPHSHAPAALTAACPSSCLTLRAAKPS